MLEDYNFLARLQIYRVFVRFYNIGGLLSTKNLEFFVISSQTLIASEGRGSELFHGPADNRIAERTYS